MFHSVALNRDMPYRVFTPARVEAAEKLPVVYLLHGGDGTFRDWSDFSDVSRYADYGLILVMPEGAFSYGRESAERTQDRYEDYLVNDLISDVETRFRVKKGRENRAMIGISMGGFAAIKLALTRPDLFIFVGAFSPSVSTPRAVTSISKARECGGDFGPSLDRQGVSPGESRDPFALVRTADPAVTPYIYMTAGDNEPLLEPDRRFAARLKELHFAFEFHVKSGGHDWGEWNSQVPGCFDSLLQHMKLDR